VLIERYWGLEGLGWRLCNQPRRFHCSEFCFLFWRTVKFMVSLSPILHTIWHTSLFPYGVCAFSLQFITHCTRWRIYSNRQFLQRTKPTEEKKKSNKIFLIAQLFFNIHFILYQCFPTFFQSRHPLKKNIYIVAPHTSVVTILLWNVSIFNTTGKNFHI